MVVPLLVSALAVASIPISGKETLAFGRAEVADSAPSWSPDGSRIAFVRTIGRANGVFTVRPDRTGLRRLARGGVPGQAPSWSRDGKRLVFARERWLGGGRLRSDAFVVRRDGRGLRRLVVGDMPVWSPDGTKIVFIRKVDYYTSSLLTVSPSGGRETLVARRVERQRPSWSFDGKLLAFTSGPKGMVISVVSADGGRPREVAWGRWPVWSPTDGRIAYAGTCHARVVDWKAPDLAGGVRPQCREWVRSPPAWSPDASQIAVAASRLASAWLMIVPLARSVPFAESPRCGYDPAWSPDGTRIAVIQSLRSGVCVGARGRLAIIDAPR
jgi:dipeptidyl aminopeptidase/acylaminoacyl peptidase